MPGTVRRSLGQWAPLGIALALVLGTPQARALTFGEGDASTNPYFFNASVDAPATSSWSLNYPTYEVVYDWGNTTCSSTSPSYPCVNYNPTGDVTIFGGPTYDTAWVSAPANAATGYNISFNYYFAPEPFNPGSQTAQATPNGYYLISGGSSSVPLTSGTPVAISLFVPNGQTLTFGIDPGSTSGDLFISNFSATPAAVPAPLPLLGAGAAFGWIRRRRAKLRSAHTLSTCGTTQA